MEHGDYLQQSDGYTCFYCHTSYEKDLQLAAELGKTLLERNKELETNLRQQQNIVEDRNQEIEYLTKQTAALREVNDSRLRIYEQLEISIQDLERNNQRLVQENLNDKKHIKNLYETIESLETRCEDLQHLVDDMGHLKKDDSIVSEGSVSEGGISASVNEDLDDYAKLVSQLEHAKNQRAKEQKKVSELEQNVSYLMKENTNLEEKVCVMQQKDQELKTLQDQIVYLEEIRQGNLCRRCQRSTDPNLFDEYSVYDDDDDTDDISAIGSYVETHKHEVLQQLQESLGENFSEDNPYRILVDKYEALLKIQQKHNAFTSTMQLQQPAGPSSAGENHGMSLHEELQMSGQFSSFNGNATDDSEDEDATAPAGGAATTTAKPEAGGGGGAGKYSETETASSSGFSDETSNKCTQTETFFTGSFLCTISDGDDCRFSIYDDASPIESRFRKTPEYRQLFREIFDVLKRAAEAKDEGEKLPLLQDDDGYAGDDGYCCYGGDDDDDDDDDADSRATSGARLLPAPPRVPPATPACETNPLVSSVAEHAAAAEQQQQQQPETETKTETETETETAAAAESAADDGQRTPTADDQRRPVAAAAAPPPPVRHHHHHHHHHHQATGEPRPRPKKLLQEQPHEQQPAEQQQRRPRQQRDIIEELASTVKHKKHARHRKSTKQSKDISHLLEFRWTDQVTRRRKSSAGGGERSSSSQRATWCVPKDSDAAAAVAAGALDRSPRHEPAAYASAASQEVAKLKLLEKSYAEVLRLRKPPSNRPQSHYFHRM